MKCSDWSWLKPPGNTKTRRRRTSSPSPAPQPAPPGVQPEDPVDFARARLDFHPDPVQARILASAAPRGILCCSRQWGKSTVCAAKAVHRAFTTPGSLVLVASPSQRQSAEMVRKIETFTRRLQIPVRGDGDNPASVLYPNGSRIVGLPGSEATVRGFSAVSLLLIDEASRVEDSLYTALRPMLAASAGALWLLSTPAGARGFFWEEWSTPSRGWERYRVPATECTRISEAFLAGERVSMSQSQFSQEYLCDFQNAAGGWFSTRTVHSAISSEVRALFPRGRR